MSTRLFRILTSLCAIVGVVMLITSFTLNPGPPPNPTTAQLTAFGNQYHNFILIGAWLQAISPALIVLFAFAIVHLAGATTRLMGWMTLFGATVLMTVSLVEIVFYLSAVNGTTATIGLISLDLIAAVQHLYSMIAAPALFFPLAVVILNSRVLPHVFGYVALVIGAAFAILGVADLFNPLQNVVNVLSIVQGFWWLGAAITLLVRTEKASDRVALKEPETAVEA